MQEDVSPLEQFIRDVVVPQQGDLNVRTNVFGHGALMLGAARSAGVKIRKVTKDHIVFLHKGEAIGGFDGRATTLASHQARRVTQSMLLTRRYLQASGLPTPESVGFSLTQYDAALQHFRSRSGEVIVSSERKHAHFASRIGITSDKEFAEIWEAEEQVLSSLDHSLQKILLTTVQPGIPLRVLTVGESVAAAVVRVPLYVVGDGTHALGQLVSAEIARRNECKHLAARQPTVDDDFLMSLSLNPRMILPSGAVQRLSSSIRGNADGRISVDVTEALAPQTGELALDAMWAIPGLSAAAVDLVAPSVESVESATVLGISAAPDVSEFRYPAYGSARHASRAIIRHLIEQSPKTTIRAS